MITLRSIIKSRFIIPHNLDLREWRDASDIFMFLKVRA